VQASSCAWDAFPGEPAVGPRTLTPYSTVGASSTPDSAERSRRQPLHDDRIAAKGHVRAVPARRWPTGTIRRGVRVLTRARDLGRDAFSLRRRGIRGAAGGLSHFGPPISPTARWPGPAPLRERGARWAWWAFAAGAALLSGSQWLHAPSVEYLVVWLVATVHRAGGRGTHRWRPNNVGPWSAPCCSPRASGAASPGAAGPSARV